MIVEVHNRLGEAQRIEATRVVVRNEYDDPICFCLEHAPGHFYYKSAGDEDFETALQRMGINSTLVVDKMIPPAPLDDTGRIWTP